MTPQALVVAAKRIQDKESKRQKEKAQEFH